MKIEIKERAQHTANTERRRYDSGSRGSGRG
jgi:hypothetical protein